MNLGENRRHLVTYMTGAGGVIYLCIFGLFRDKYVLLEPL